MSNNTLQAEIDQLDEIVIFQKEKDKPEVWDLRIKKFITELDALQK